MTFELDFKKLMESLTAIMAISLFLTSLCFTSFLVPKHLNGECWLKRSK